MLLTDLNTGNELIRKINLINDTIAKYDQLHVAGGSNASSVTFSFSEFGSITFNDSDQVVVQSIAAEFITSLISYRNNLQTSFDSLGNSQSI